LIALAKRAIHIFAVAVMAKKPVNSAEVFINDICVSKLEKEGQTEIVE